MFTIPANPSQMRVVSVEQLRAELKSYPIGGTKIATLVTLTQPKMKTGSPIQVSRLAHRRVYIGASYEAAVNVRRGVEAMGEEVEYFNAEALWKGHGVRIEGEPYLVTHRENGGLYFAIKPYQVPTDTAIGTAAPVLEDIYRDLATGRRMSLAQVQPWFYPQYKANKQGLRHDVMWRTIKLENVLQVRWNHEHFVLRRAA